MEAEPSRDEGYIDWGPLRRSATPPPQRTIAWVEHTMNDRVRRVHELPGGLSSSVHRLEFETSSQGAVLRRYTLTDWLEREPNVPHDEARILRLLVDLDVGVATPTPIAADPDGQHCDAPAIVMTEVAGRPDIDPADPGRWAEQLATCLAGIHRTAVPAGLGHYERWDRPNRPLPEWTERPDLWRRAIGRGAGPLPQHRPVLLHRDFHPNNVHWRDGEICGVVDWLAACVGPAAADLAHCRWNLAMLAGAATADRFTEHYRAITGYREDVAAYDLATILSGPVGPFPTFAWNDLGRSDLTSESVAKKIDAWLGHILG